MRYYRFSPITDEKTAQITLDYIQTELKQLAKMAIGESLPINTLKIFAHYENEHEYLFKWINQIGQKDEISSANSYYVKPFKPLIIGGESMEYLGLRVPDPYRCQVGCGDFVVDDFDEFKNKYLNKSEFVREVDHPRFHLMELFHPDIDVLGYVVKE